MTIKIDQNEINSHLRSWLFGFATHALDTEGDFDGLNEDELCEAHTHAFNSMDWSNPDHCYKLKEGIKYSDIICHDQDVHVTEYFQYTFNEYQDEYLDQVDWYFIIRDALFGMGVIDNRGAIQTYIEDEIQKKIEKERKERNEVI